LFGNAVIVFILSAFLSRFHFLLLSWVSTGFWSGQFVSSLLDILSVPFNVVQTGQLLLEILCALTYRETDSHTTITIYQAALSEVIMNVQVIIIINLFARNENIHNNHKVYMMAGRQKN